MASNNNQIWRLRNIVNGDILGFHSHIDIMMEGDYVIWYLCRILLYSCDHFVVVPPHQMLLYDKSGADVSGVVGPLEEGAALVLVCEVRGGK